MSYTLEGLKIMSIFDYKSNRTYLMTEDYFNWLVVDFITIEYLKLSEDDRFFYKIIHENK